MNEQMESALERSDISFLETQKLAQDELLIKSWLAGKSENTRRSYFRIADELLAWVYPVELKKISIHHVQSFLEVRASQKRATYALKVAAIKSLLTYGSRTGYLTANLGVFIPGVKSDSKLTDRYLSEEEVLSMIEAAHDVREQAVIRLLYSGGLRVSELVSLNWEDLQMRDEGESQVKIRGKGDNLRVVMISKTTTDALQRLKLNESKPWKPIFSSDYGSKTRLTDRTVRDLVFRLAMRADIRKKVSPHWLRHAHASHALDRGAPIHLVQSTLGHASVATTGRYLHSRPKESSGKYLVE